VRRTVATLLVVATALLMAEPVGATEPRPTDPAAALAVDPAVVQAPSGPGVQAPGPVTAALIAPAVEAAAIEAPVVAAPAAPAVARPAVKPPRAKALTRAGLGDTAYAARLQAELCRARQIFCGLDHSGRYPGR
jgi:hypothetical protein